LLSSQFSSAQIVEFPIDSTTHKVTCSELVPRLGVPSSTIYNNAIAFVDYYLKPSGVVLRSLDEESKKVTARGTYTYLVSVTAPTERSGAQPRGESRILYSLIIQCHDGSYTYTFTDFIMTDRPSEYAGNLPGGDFDEDKSGKVPKRKWQKVKSYVDSEVKKSIEFLKKRMSDNKG
jgi:Domain of unknown function (DUF4468) with TBP-like fold